MSTELKKVLFVDRDGTIIREPEDFQIDSLEKLEMVPYTISSLKRLQDLGWSLVMISNQDGLGTESFPTEDFEAPHEKMMQILTGEGIVFEQIFVDPSLPEENSPNRKPRTGMVDGYLTSITLDAENSYVIGDRDSDMEFAKNIGIEGIQIDEETFGWGDIVEKIIK